jgi:hypothetical protein
MSLETFEREWAKIEKEYNDHPGDALFALAESSSDFVIFGYGVLGQVIVAEDLVGVGAKLVAFCDNFKTGFDEHFSIPIINPEQLRKEYSDAVVVIAVSEPHNTEIYAQLTDMGFSEKSLFQRYGELMYIGLEEFRVKHYDGYKWAYEFFEDECTRKVVLDNVRGHLFPFRQTCSPANDQYFDVFTIGKDGC